MRLMRSRYLTLLTLACLILTSIPLPATAAAADPPTALQPADETIVYEDFANGPLVKPWYDMHGGRVSFDGQNAVVGGQGDGGLADLAWMGGDHQGFIHAPKRDDEVIIYETVSVMAAGMGPEYWMGSSIGFIYACFHNGQGPSTQVVYYDHTSRYGDLRRTIDLGANYADGQPHYFVVEAYAKKVVFHVDGRVVASPSIEGWPYSLVLYDSTIGYPYVRTQNLIPGNASKVDWIRVTRKTALVAPQVINGIQDPLNYAPQ